MAHKVTAVVFDKTGTLTEANPQVVAFESGNGDARQLLNLAASLQLNLASVPSAPTVGQTARTPD